MVSTRHAAHDIEITAESLQEDLARLQVQKQALERELAAVVAHLGSVQRALGALQALIAHPVTSVAPGPTADELRRAATPDTPKAVNSPSGQARTPSKSDSAPGPRRPRNGNASGRPATTAADGDGQKKYGRLTEQIMEYLASVGDADVRARDVAAALGRDKDSGGINGVRSTLDRLVGASRVQRTGRGLYRAKRP